MNDQIKHIVDILTGYLLNYGINVIGAIATLVIGSLVAGWVARLIDQAIRRSTRIDPVFHNLPGKIVRVAILIFTLVAVLNRFGVETTSLIAVLGAAGLAVGLALQGTLSNVAAGVMILFFRPFKIGDVVQLESDVYIIDAVGFFICKGHLIDGPTVFIPNSKIWGHTIVNLSVTDNDIRRIHADYGIAYTDNIGTALAILKQVAADDPRILATPAPLIKVDKLGDSSVNIMFRVWTSRTDWWDTKLDLVQACKEALEAGGCSLPFPQRDVHHFYETPSASKSETNGG